MKWGVQEVKINLCRCIPTDILLLEPLTQILDAFLEVVLYLVKSC